MNNYYKKQKINVALKGHNTDRFYLFLIHVEHRCTITLNVFFVKCFNLFSEAIKHFENRYKFLLNLQEINISTFFI